MQFNREKSVITKTIKIFNINRNRKREVLEKSDPKIANKYHQVTQQTTEWIFFYNNKQTNRHKHRQNANVKTLRHFFKKGRRSEQISQEKVFFVKKEKHFFR